MHQSLTILLSFFTLTLFAQKKPVHHAVFDTWESVGAKQLSPNGQWATYEIVLKEGDGNLNLINLTTNSKIKIPRASQFKFSADSKFAAFHIKPLFSTTQMGMLGKKNPEASLKDSLGYINLTTRAIIKHAGIQSFKIPEKEGAFLIYHKASPTDTSKINPSAEGTDLILINLLNGVERTFKYVTAYDISKNGKQLIFASSGSRKDPSAKAGVFLYQTEKAIIKTLVAKKGNYSGFVFDNDSEQLAFLGENTSDHVEVKDYQIYYNSLTLDTAQVLVDNEIEGLPAEWAVSRNSQLIFSKEGTKLYFGIAPLIKVKDKSLDEPGQAQLDIWSYKDGYSALAKFKNIKQDAQRSYLSVIEIYSSDPRVVPLADLNLPDATIVNEGDAKFVLAATANSLNSERSGAGLSDYYLVDTKTGTKKKIISGLNGFAKASPGGNYIVFFDKKTSQWATYAPTTGKTTVLTLNSKVKFADEDKDTPNTAEAYGLAGWTEDDKQVLIYDRFDIWNFSADGKSPGKEITNGYGRQHKITFRYTAVEPDTRFITRKDDIWLTAFNHETKEQGFFRTHVNSNNNPSLVVSAKSGYSKLIKATAAEKYIYDKGNYNTSTNVYVSTDLKTETQLSLTNPQQQTYNWGTAELMRWNTPGGTTSEGVLYKPENFDPAQKYPLIVTIDEKSADSMYNYIPNNSCSSNLNIPYFTSNGYLVFATGTPHVKGYPGKAAEETVSSGVEFLKKNTWLDGSKIGIHGQSLGGYQVAHLLTKSNNYAAAWAGAPVVNMTAVYSGVPWDTGINATLWEKPEEYIENSPLFNLPKINTPVAIMANDADSVIPWQQGIEMFSGLKRLGKVTWLLNYRNEGHDLLLLQNRKDLQVRQQQFFDYYLKGAKAPVWMTQGITAVEK